MRIEDYDDEYSPTAAEASRVRQADPAAAERASQARAESQRLRRQIVADARAQAEERQTMNKTERFVNSKCDRCGRTTPARQNNEGELFTLPDEWGEPFADEGSFCQRCIDQFPAADWLQWLALHRPVVE